MNEKNLIMIVGCKVTYQPFKNAKAQKGIVKEVVDAENLRVVYHCAGDWANYKNYTAALTPVDRLTAGWPEPACEHEYVFKILQDYTAVEVCRLCGKAKKQLTPTHDYEVFGLDGSRIVQARTVQGAIIAAHHYDPVMQIIAVVDLERGKDIITGCHEYHNEQLFTANEVVALVEHFMVRGLPKVVPNANMGSIIRGILKGIQSHE